MHVVGREEGFMHVVGRKEGVCACVCMKGGGGGYACGWEKRVCVCMWLGEEGMCMHVVG